jgi:tight adherence protein B
MLILIAFFAFICVTLIGYNLTPLLRRRADQFVNLSLKQAEAYLDSLYLEMQAQQVLYAAVIASIAGFGLGLLLSYGALFVGIVFAAIGYFLPNFYFKLQRQRRRDKLNEQLVPAIEMLSNALRAGTNFTQALALIPQEMSAPIGQEINIVLREMELGVTQEAALKNLTQRAQSPEYELVVAATNIARETGGNLAETFDRIAKTIRDRNEVLGKVQALTAEGKMQGIFVGLLPLFLGGALMILDPKMMQPMFATPLGYGLIAAVIILEAMGAYFIKKVITIDV